MKAKTEFHAVLQFWFQEAGPPKWFGKDAGFDDLIRQRFGVLHVKASHCELFSWRDHIKGRLAEIILLDQFSRNLFRDSPKAFAQDAQALTLAQETLKVPEIKDLTTAERGFLYMPFMHSESIEMHEIAAQLFAEPGLEENLKFEILHKELIDRFGRYPHRNEILERTSTPEELEFLSTTKIKF